MFERATDDKFVAKSFLEEFSKRQFRCKIVLGGAAEKDNFVANAFSRSLEEFMKRTISSQKYVSSGYRKGQFRAEHVCGVSEKHSFLAKSFWRSNQK